MSENGQSAAASTFAPRRGLSSRATEAARAETDNPEHIPTAEHPNPTWHNIIATIKDAEDADLMKVMGYLINTKLDCIKMFEGRDRFMLHDIQNVYLAMPFFIDTDKLTRRK